MYWWCRSERTEESRILIYLLSLRFSYFTFSRAVLQWGLLRSLSNEFVLSIPTITVANDQLAIHRWCMLEDFSVDLTHVSFDRLISYLMCLVEKQSITIVDVLLLCFWLICCFGCLIVIDTSGRRAQCYMGLSIFQVWNFSYLVSFIWLRITRCTIILV